MRWTLALLLVLVACQQIEPTQYEPYERPQDEPLRPDIPRTYEEPVPTPTEQPTGGETAPPAPDIIPHLTLEVPIGSVIGDKHPRITSEGFPLLRHKPIERAAGVPVYYDEEILFRKNGTGRVEFGQDRDTEEIGTFLRFAEDETMFEYRITLDHATFEGLQGRRIQVLGHTYLIAYADNRTVALFGQDIASNLLFENGSTLTVSDEPQADTDVRVLPDLIAYRAIAHGDDDGGDILLSTGESLSENIGKKHLASLFFDIRYDGTDTMDTDRIALQRNKFGYVLSYDGPDGPVAIPLAEQDAGALVLGKADEPLHIVPCKANTHCIGKGDAVLLTTPDRRAYALTYSDMSERPPELIMRATHNVYHYEIVGNLTRNDSWTDIIVGDTAFRTRIGPNATGTRNLSVTIPAKPELATRSGYLIRLHEPKNDTLPLEIVIPAARTLAHREEKISANITYDGDWTITVGGNLTLTRDEDTDDVLGQTPYGVGILLKQDDPLAENQATELTLLLPAEQSFGKVRLEG